MSKILSKALAAIQKVIDGAEEWKPVVIDEVCALLPTNDLGNGERLCKRFGQDLMHVAELQRNKRLGWVGWAGTRWSVEDGDRMARAFTHQVVAGMKAELRYHMWKGAIERPDGTEESNAQFSDRLESFAKAVFSAGNAPKLAGMLSASQPYLTRLREELDTKPDIFNCANGTLELRADGTVKLRQPAREDMNTKQSPVKYDPKATCPKWEKFIVQVQPQDDKRAFLQRYLGYCLCGDASEQLILLMYGLGSNGKSTVIDVLRAIIADMAATLPISSILEQEHKSGGEAQPELARLYGMRVAVAAEPEKRKRLSTQRVKDLTGGDRIIVRHLHGDFFEFYAQFKIIVSFNTRPTVPTQDKGMWRRLALLGFDVTIEEKDIIRGLAKMLVDEEASGILNWLIAGWKEWKRIGLAVPDSVRAATEEYRADNDTLSDFIAAKVRPMQGAYLGATDLFNAYREWCEVTREPKPMRQKGFGDAMAERGYRKVKKSTWHYIDIWLTDRSDAEAVAAAGLNL